MYIVIILVLLFIVFCFMYMKYNIASIPSLKQKIKDYEKEKDIIFDFIFTKIRSSIGVEDTIFKSLCEKIERYNYCKTEIEHLKYDVARFENNKRFIDSFKFKKKEDL